MSTSKKLNIVFKSSKQINIDDNSKVIIMSDCHRGNGTISDNFSKNKNIFLAALNYYYNNDYTYIELGDGDELWENKSFKDIITNNKDVFEMLSKFYQKNKFYMLFGNHDIVKKKKLINDHIMNGYYDDKIKKYITLFSKMEIYEGLILKYTKSNDKIFLTHGHQGDFLNDTIWRVARFLVRYIWRPLESIGIHNPTSAATNKKKKKCVEKKLINWTKKYNQMLIAGHTHKPVFPKIGEHLYFNDGCCTLHMHITGIEILDGSMSLIKWQVKTKTDRTLYVEKEILYGPISLEKYFNSV